MTPEEVPAELVNAAAWALAELPDPDEGDGTAEVRAMLAAALSVYDQGVTPRATNPSPQFTVLVAEYHQHINYWCHQNRRNPRDQTIIRIVNGPADAIHRLQGLTDFELVVLSPCRHYDETMALIMQRQSMSRKDRSQ